MFIFFAKKIIEETQKGLKDVQHWDDVIECSEDDL